MNKQITEKLTNSIINHFNTYFQKQQSIDKWYIDNNSRQFGDFQYPGVNGQLCFYKNGIQDDEKITSFCLECNWDETSGLFRIVFGVRRREFVQDPLTKEFNKLFKQFFGQQGFYSQNRNGQGVFKGGQLSLKN